MMIPLVLPVFTSEPQLQEALRHFSLTEFRPGQKEVIQGVLVGRNALVVMPTGAGKSLCYQLPATLLPGISLVVSPLIALMKDQVEQLNAKGIPATYINSSLSDTERSERLQQIRRGQYKLVYVAPERFRSNSFLQLVSEVGVDLLAIDEAHCISQWGHDFRPDYATLGQVRKHLRPPRTIALTATATPEVQNDIVKSLLMKDPQILVAGFDRPNLFLEVTPVKNDEERRAYCAETVQQSEGSGIIYCSTRKSAESTYSDLKKRRQRVFIYHAGMDDEARHRAQDEFMGSPRAVAVATNAFGMGIDKADIRYVVHFNIPKAVEAYYQEMGRAGRDGHPARAVLLFNHADVYTQERMIQGSYPSESIFADVWSVLHRAGEEYTQGIQGLVTRTGSSDFEVSAALRILEREGKIARTSRGEGLPEVCMLEKALTLQPHAPEAKALLPLMLQSLSIGRPVTHELVALAKRSGLDPEAFRHALTLLEKAGALAVRRPFSGRTIRLLQPVPFGDLGLNLKSLREQERRTLLLLKRMTDYAYSKLCRRNFILRYFGESPKHAQCHGCDVCTAKSEVKKVAPKPSSIAMDSDFAMTELRRFRSNLAKDLEIPAFIIFNDKTLTALSTELPTDRDAFLKVKGTGPAKWEQFGPKIVDICQKAKALSN